MRASSRRSEGGLCKTPRAALCRRGRGFWEIHRFGHPSSLFPQLGGRSTRLNLMSVGPGFSCVKGDSCVGSSVVCCAWGLFCTKEDSAPRHRRLPLRRGPLLREGGSHFSESSPLIRAGGGAELRCRQLTILRIASIRAAKLQAHSLRFANPESWCRRSSRSPSPKMPESFGSLGP